VLGKAVPIRYGSGGSVTAVLVNDVVTLPAANSSSSSSSFVGGAGFMQQFGMATQMQQPNASTDASQPWDGIIVSGCNWHYQAMAWQNSFEMASYRPLMSCTVQKKLQNPVQRHAAVLANLPSAPAAVNYDCKEKS
jgi:hypothetical protein